MDPLDQYFSEQFAAIQALPRAELAAILDILERARGEGRHIYVFGNGGSASTASHFACDLGKNTVRNHLPRFQVTCLNDNMALFSAYANDEGYDRVFVEPLLSLSEPGDVVIAFSASGNSPNVLRALEAANARGLVTIGFGGMGGGKMHSLAQHCVIVDSNSYEHIEDLHLMLCHALVMALKARGSKEQQVKSDDSLPAVGSLHIEESG